MTSVDTTAKPRVALLIAALWLVGCSAGHQETLRPPVSREHTEYGAPGPGNLTLASWYGPGFIGQRTASGETYHKNDLTAASRSLPLGTRVQVTNLHNGRSVIVRINDRGPYVRGRGIDLSERAARDIGLNRSGIARVAVTRLDATASAAESTPPPSQWQGEARVTHHYRARTHRHYYHLHHYYRYVSSSTYHRSHEIVADPVGEWLFQMLR